MPQFRSRKNGQHYPLASDPRNSGSFSTQTAHLGVPKRLQKRIDEKAMQIQDYRPDLDRRTYEEVEGKYRVAWRGTSGLVWRDFDTPAEAAKFVAGGYKSNIPNAEISYIGRRGKLQLISDNTNYTSYEYPKHLKSHFDEEVENEKRKGRIVEVTETPTGYRLVAYRFMKCGKLSELPKHPIINKKFKIQFVETIPEEKAVRINGRIDGYEETLHPVQRQTFVHASSKQAAKNKLYREWAEADAMTAAMGAGEEPPQSYISKIKSVEEV